MPIRRALLSVADADEVAPMARMLSAFAVEVFATPRTAAALRELDVAVNEIPAPDGAHGEIGSTLAAMSAPVHAGLLATDAPRFDLVVVGLTAPRGDPDPAAGVDVEGLVLLHGAARSYEHVVVVVDPLDHFLVLLAVSEGRDLDRATRRRLAAKAFACAAAHENRAAAALSDGAPPDWITWTCERVGLAPMAEGAAGGPPLAPGAIYREAHPPPGNIVQAMQLHDADAQETIDDYVRIDAALALARAVAMGPTVVVTRGGALVSAVRAATVEQACRLALDGQDGSGTIVAIVGHADPATLRRILQSSVRCVAATWFEAEGLVDLQENRHLRLFAVGEAGAAGAAPAWTSVAGGLWLHEPSRRRPELDEVPGGSRVLTASERSGAVFATQLCRAMPSCAAVLVRPLDGDAIQTTAIAVSPASTDDAIRRAIRSVPAAQRGSVLAVGGPCSAEGMASAVFAGVTVLTLPAGPHTTALRAAMSGSLVTLLEARP